LCCIFAMSAARGYDVLGECLILPYLPLNKAFKWVPAIPTNQTLFVFVVVPLPTPQFE